MTFCKDKDDLKLCESKEIVKIDQNYFYQKHETYQMGIRKKAKFDLDIIRWVETLQMHVFELK